MRAENGSWRSAAEDYFNWRAQKYNYQPDLDGARAAAATPAGQRQRFRRLREAAEQAIRSKLVDPSSAEFSWPNGFTNGTWKPLLQKRVEGWITCGEVNAKNRMGGYAGRSSFVVVLSEDGQSVIFSEFDDYRSGSFGGLVAAQCRKSASFFPRPQEGMLDRIDAAPATQGIADELRKLGELKEKGLLTEEEFRAQKAKLLSR
jgi:hypothetical protein